MKLTADDYRRHYRELSDEEFLAIDRDDLVDVARRCYDAELTRRQLAPEHEPEQDSEGMAEFAPAPIDEQALTGEDLVQVGLLTDRDTAKYAQKMLHEADVPSFLTSAITLPGSYAIGTIAIKVSPACADAARDLLAGILTGSNKTLVQNWFEKDWTPEDLDLADFSVAVDDILGEEDRVAVRLTITGASPGTRQEAQIGGLAIVRITGGEIAETWIKLDS